MPKHHTISEKFCAVKDYESYKLMDAKMKKQLGLTTEIIALRHGVSARELKRWFAGECIRENDSKNDVPRSDRYGKHPSYPPNIVKPKRGSKYANETEEEKAERMREVNRQKYLRRKESDDEEEEWCYEHEQRMYNEYGEKCGACMEEEDNEGGIAP